MSNVCQFEFPEELDREYIEKQLAVAIIATECTFGQPRVRINAAYCISPPGENMDSGKGPQVAIDVSSDVGEHIAQIFTGLMIRQLGEDRFTVDRVKT